MVWPYHTSWGGASDRRLISLQGYISLVLGSASSHTLYATVSQPTRDYSLSKWILCEFLSRILECQNRSGVVPDVMWYVNVAILEVSCVCGGTEEDLIEWIEWWLVNWLGNCGLSCGNKADLSAISFRLEARGSWQTSAMLHTIVPLGAD